MTTTKHIGAAVSAAAFVFVFAAAASAQTVPAEAWVGAPIATTAGAFSRGEVTADMQRSMSARQAAQDAWVGPASEVAISVGAARRSEVAADFNLYQRAGLAAYQSSEAFDPYSAQGQRRIAAYQRMRNGPEFAREVARIEGTGSTLARAAATGTGTSE